MNPLEKYLKDVSQTSGAGVPETSYYPALRNLFDDIGSTLKPAVNCVINPKSHGSGIPDGGFYTPDQSNASAGAGGQKGAIPARGVLEVKDASADVRKVAKSQQVLKYLGKYRLALVTNLRDFVLVEYDPASSSAKQLESYRLAQDEAEFWELLKDHENLASVHHSGFSDFLKRVLTHEAPLAAPKDVAWMLASYAREARDRLKTQGTTKSLEPLREAFEKALGITFEGEEGASFFRSTIVQTLFYGVFSGWVLWNKDVNGSGAGAPSQNQFRWQDTRYYLSVPIIEQLFSQMTSPQMLKQSNLKEVLEWAERALNRVDETSFFTSFDTDDAVQYFYEPFLEAFDPELRKRYGVWYTPKEVVKYMVERIDIALRDELDIPDGLADERVYVLDPCTGTGSYLLEVARRIEKTMIENHQGDLAGETLKAAMQNRLFGFELLPAPFVVAHLKLGLMLRDRNAPLQGDERAGVYLTNALTGWDATRKPLKFPFPGFDEEVDAASDIKNKQPILVVLGNPPYDAFAGVSPEQEDNLVTPYKDGLIKRWGIKKFNLDDLYVRFFRVAERRIAEGMPGKGILCYISSFSYLRGASFTVMRERLFDAFDSIWIDSLNGDSRETGKKTPEGLPDPSVFSTPQNKAGIRVGTAISLMVRTGDGTDRETTEAPSQDGSSETGEQTAVRFREFWGSTKRNDLLDSLSDSQGSESNKDSKQLVGDYSVLLPAESNRYSFRPWEASKDYLAWAPLDELCVQAPENGLMEKRGGALIDIDQKALETRMRAYHDPEKSWDDLVEMGTGLSKDAARFEAKAARQKVQEAGGFLEENLVRYSVRPFDTRWAYYSNTRPLWNEPRPRLKNQLWKENSFLVSRPSSVSSPEGVPLFFTRALGDNDSLKGHAYYIPQLWKEVRTKKRKGDEDALFEEQQTSSSTKANLSEKAEAYLGALGLSGVGFKEAARLLWMHVLAIGYSPLYLEENAGGVKEDWLRIPLPNDAATLRSSAQLGKVLSELLDSDSPVQGVDSGKIRTELLGIGEVKNGSGNLHLDANWGYRDARGVVMPGNGTAQERAYKPEEQQSIADGAAALNLTTDEMFPLLGERTYDVYLNDTAYWKNVPQRVWDFRIGGYQVIKKWLSYRESELLGRNLTVSEAKEVTSMMRRIAAILLLGKRLDENYEGAKTRTYSW